MLELVNGSSLPWRLCPSSIASSVSGENPMFLMLGGSNSAGANALEHQRLGPQSMDIISRVFAQLFLEKLHATNVDLRKRADGGSSPLFAGACASQFVSKRAIGGTIEYLPNIGFIKDNEAEVGTMSALMA